jgi:hypothetical protein
LVTEDLRAPGLVFDSALLKDVFDFNFVLQNGGMFLGSHNFFIVGRYWPRLLPTREPSDVVAKMVERHFLNFK